jgi:hypothetical protein
VTPPKLGLDKIVVGSLKWQKFSSTSRDYSAGFVTSLALSGYKYSPPAGFDLILGLSGAVTNIKITLNAGSTDDFTAPLAITGFIDDKEKFTPTSSTYLPKLTVNASTGFFSGNFTLPAAGVLPARLVNYQGWLWNVGSSSDAFGHFMVPALPLPTGKTLLTAPRVSGIVKLGPP